MTTYDNFDALAAFVSDGHGRWNREVLDLFNRDGRIRSLRQSVASIPENGGSHEYARAVEACIAGCYRVANILRHEAEASFADALACRRDGYSDRHAIKRAEVLYAAACRLHDLADDADGVTRGRYAPLTPAESLEAAVMLDTD